MKIIDAEGKILGRMASHVAKSLLMGEEMAIINSEKAIVTGNKKAILQNYKEKFDRGHRYKGPFFPKMPHRLVKRVVRGMLPWKKPKGRTAFKRLKTYIGVPKELEGKKVESVPEIEMARSRAPRFVRVEEISRFLGWQPKG